MSPFRPGPWVWPAIAITLFLGIVGAWIAGSCERRRDGPGQRADSVLATDSLYLERIKDQDSTIARLEDSIRATDRDRVRWKDSAHTLTRAADASQAAIDSTVAAGVPPGVEPAVFWKDQYEAQRRVAVRLRSETVPALLATIAADSLGIKQRDDRASELLVQRDFARMRTRQITAEFRDYRQATREGIDLGFIRLPEWADDVALVVGTATLTYVVTK